jgi:hypothetical protein
MILRVWRSVSILHPPASHMAQRASYSRGLMRGVGTPGLFWKQHTACRAGPAGIDTAGGVLPLTRVPFLNLSSGMAVSIIPDGD